MICLALSLLTFSGVSGDKTGSKVTKLSKIAACGPDANPPVPVKSVIPFVISFLNS